MIEYPQHLAALSDGKKSTLLVEDRPNKAIVIGAPHHAPGGVKTLPCPEHSDSDQNTGLIAQRLAKRLQVPAVIACNATVDPNKSLDTNYSRQILRWKPGFFVEIHGHGGKKAGADVIEISSGSIDANNLSMYFAEVLQHYLHEFEAFKKLKVLGDFDKIHYKASKTVTILYNEWQAVHIELPPSLRIGDDRKLPDTIEDFLNALERTIRFVLLGKKFGIKPESESLKE